MKDEQTSSEGKSGAIVPETVHLAYLDGLRGLAALYVVFYHCQMLLGFRIGNGNVTGVRQWVFKFFDNGHAAVSVFIVLSGYVLMLPVARSAEKRLRGGLQQFVARRARRILPPYYGALFLFSGLIGLTNLLHIPTDFSSELTPGTFLSHLLLVHNLNKDYLHRIDGPMWSLATEWQIYFLFALVLLPLYRRLGIAMTMALALIATVLPHYLLPSTVNLDQACPWYLGLFAFGMGAACLHFDQSLQGRFRAIRVPWSALALVFLLLFIVCSYAPPLRSLPPLSEEWFRDVLFGLATACLLIHCTGNILARPAGIPPVLALGVLQSRPLLFLGTFSYSLYLFHQPTLDYTIQMLRHLHLNHGLIRLATVASLPFVIGFCYLCYRIFEQPIAHRQSFVRAKTDNLTERNPD